MTENQLEKIAELLNSAKKNIKRKKYANAIKLLEELLQNEHEHVTKHEIITNARNLLKQIEKKENAIKSRNVFLSLFFVIALFIIFLHWMDVLSTTIEIHLSLSEFKISLNKKLEISSLRVKSIGLSLPDSLSIDVCSVKKASAYDKMGNPIDWQSINVGEQLVLKKEEDKLRLTLESDYLNLTSLLIDSSAELTLIHHKEIGNQISLRIYGGQIIGFIDTGEEITLTGSNFAFGSNYKNHHTQTKSLLITPFVNQINFETDNRDVEILLEFAETDQVTSAIMLATDVPIQAINFTRFFGDIEESTIEGDGLIYFSELDNKPFKIKEGDFLLIDRLKKFAIRKLQLNDRLKLVLEGKVGILKTGSKLFLYSRMPSWLDWLSTNHSTTLIIGTLISIFSLIIVITSYFKNFEKN